MTVRVIPVSPIVLRDASPFFRQPPRLPVYRQDDFDAQFDFKTLTYDVFSQQGTTVLSGPPLLNLKKEFLRGKFLIDGADVSKRVKVRDLIRHQRIEIPWQGHAHGQGTTLSASVLGENFEVSINPDCSSIFAGRRVLFTMQKNNRLDWLQDWVAFYAVNHGVDGVLIYDNNSDAYDLNELKQALTTLKEIEIVIVPWNFKFGPGRHPDPSSPRETLSDSKFCQLGGLEHARFRFLSQATWVINADVDELLVVRQGTLQSNLAAQPRSLGLSFPSRWIEAIDIPCIDPKKQILEGRAGPSFAEYLHFDKTQALGHRKWIVIPAKVARKHQWTVHSINKHRLPSMNEDIGYFAHFKGINTLWKKTARTDNVLYDPTKHEMDGALVGHLLRAIPEKLRLSMNQFLAQTARPQREKT